MALKKLSNNNTFDDFCLKCLKLRRDESANYNEYKITRIDWAVYQLDYRLQEVTKVVNVVELINAIRIHKQLERIDSEVQYDFSEVPHEK